MQAQHGWDCNMLEKMLELINRNGTLSPAEIARQLNVHPALVTVMLEDLQRRGLLRKMDLDSTCTGDACDGCSLTSSCKSPKPRVWEINSLP